MTRSHPENSQHGMADFTDDSETVVAHLSPERIQLVPKLAETQEIPVPQEQSTVPPEQTLPLQEPPTSPEQVESKSSVQSSKYALGILLLVMVTVIFGSTFPVIKGTISSLSPKVLIAVRSGIAAVVLAPFIRNLNISLLRDGTIMGLLFFGGFATEVIGLETISANRGAFTFGLNVVFVTMFEFLFGKRLSVSAILAAVLAFAGIGIMSWESGEPLNGEVWLIVCALFDSACILVIERFAPRHPPLQLAAVGLWVPAVLSLLWAAPELTNQLEAIEANLGGLIYLGVVATAILTYLEAQGQRWVPGNEVAIVRSLEPVFAAILSFLLLGETFQTLDFIGAGMVLAAMILVLSRRKDEESSSLVSASPEDVADRKDDTGEVGALPTLEPPTTS